MDQFLQEVFSKAQEESGEKSLKKWAEYIADYLSEELKYPLSVKTLERYYNGETEPSIEKKNKLAMFLGYIDFKHYLSAKQGSRPEEEECEETTAKKAKSNSKIFMICIIGFSLLGAGYLGYSSGSEDCMLWKDDHYEMTSCEGKSGETKKISYLLENFKQIQVSDTTTFFKNGEANVWYDKHNNELYYFSAPGINPETGKTVKEITEYMVNKHIRKR